LFADPFTSVLLPRLRSWREGCQLFISVMAYEDFITLKKKKIKTSIPKNEKEPLNKNSSIQDIGKMDLSELNDSVMYIDITTSIINAYTSDQHEILDIGFFFFCFLEFFFRSNSCEVFLVYS
jgi:hypothetical protein